MAGRPRRRGCNRDGKPPKECSDEADPAPRRRRRWLSICAAAPGRQPRPRPRSRSSCRRATWMSATASSRTVTPCRSASAGPRARGCCASTRRSRDCSSIVDYDRKRMSMVREAEHAVLDMNAPASVMAGLQNRLDTTTRGTDETVAGLTCTNWQTTDAANKPATACITRGRRAAAGPVAGTGRAHRLLGALCARRRRRCSAFRTAISAYPADKLPGMGGR